MILRQILDQQFLNFQEPVSQYISLKLRFVYLIFSLYKLTLQIFRQSLCYQFLVNLLNWQSVCVKLHRRYFKLNNSTANDQSSEFTTNELFIYERSLTSHYNQGCLVSSLFYSNLYNIVTNHICQTSCTILKPLMLLILPRKLKQLNNQTTFQDFSSLSIGTFFII